MNALHRAKIRRLYTGRSLYCLIAGFGFLIVLISSNQYSNVVAQDVTDLFSVTAEYALLFVPLGMVVIYNSFDYRNIYRLRFDGNKTWLKKELAFMMAVLTVFTLFYSVLAILVDLFNIALLHNILLRLDWLSGFMFLLLILKRFAFLTLILFLSMIIYIAVKKSFLLILFITYAGLLVVQLAEIFIFQGDVILRPVLNYNLSLLGNLIHSMPMISAAIVVAAIFNYSLRGVR